MSKEPIIYNPDPKDAQAVWAVPKGVKAQFRPRYLVLLLFLLTLMTLTGALGTVSVSNSDGTAIARCWPASALQIVFSIWFGVYGAIAGIIGPILGNSLVGNSGLLFIPANAFQSCFTGLLFRYCKLDPRLRSLRDWASLILLGCVAGNIIGAVFGVTESYIRNPHLIEVGVEAGFWTSKFMMWSIGNTLPSLLLAPALLKVVSPIVVRGPLFCRRFLGGTYGQPGHEYRLRFRDLPMMAKLMLLTLVAGIIPLSVVAGWSVWDMMKTADITAAGNNYAIVHETRSEVERHELLLQLWATKLDQPDLNDQERKEMLRRWEDIPNTFKDLAIVDLSHIKQEITPEVYQAILEQGVMFYAERKVDRPFSHEFLRCIVRLPYTHEKVLTGMVVWYKESSFDSDIIATGGVIVLDEAGNERYRRVPTDLEDWYPPEQEVSNLNYKIKYADQTWHVAEIELPRLGWRFIRLASAKSGRTTVLANVPNPVAVLINLAIFGSLIAGSIMAKRISDKVLAIAEKVQETGAKPGKLRIPVRGRDELGYLSGTLNRMSQELAENVRRLQETTAEKERLEAEMKLAREVQMSILPSRPPQVPGYEFAAVSYPAREVGGDFFDFISGGDDRMVMTIGDAVGKGLRAAMLITETHGLLHAAMLDKLKTPEGILDTVNSAVLSSWNETSDFVTMFCGLLNHQQHHLLYAGAGHNPPVLLRQGQTRNLELGGLPLAVMPDGNYQLHSVNLEPADAVIMYTDGVTEAMNTKRQMYGTEKLCSLLREYAGRSAAEIVDDIVKSVLTFTAEAPQADDITLLVLRRCGIENSN